MDPSSERVYVFLRFERGSARDSLFLERQGIFLRPRSRGLGRLPRRVEQELLHLGFLRVRARGALRAGRGPRVPGARPIWRRRLPGPPHRTALLLRPLRPRGHDPCPRRNAFLRNRGRAFLLLMGRLVPPCGTFPQRRPGARGGRRRLPAAGRFLPRASRDAG